MSVSEPLLDQQDEPDGQDELRAARERHGIPPGGPDGRSLAERAGDDLDLTEHPEELFFLDQGRRVTIGQLIAQGTPIEYRVTLNSKSFKGGSDMGLLPFTNPNMILVVPCRQAKIVIDPTYDDDGTIEKVTMRVNWRPLTAHDAASAEGRALVPQGD